MTGKILQLLDDREKHFMSLTDQLLDLLKPVVFVAIEERMTEQKRLGTGQQLSWQQVMSVPSLDLLIILGTIEYPPGFLATLADGSEFEVTEATAPYFSFPIRVGMPISLADTGSVEEIKTYLQEQDKKSDEETAKQLEADIESFHPDYDDIDTSSLTEEQRKFLFHLPPGEKPN